MQGIFYDRKGRQLHRVTGSGPSDWLLVTHNLDAGAHYCRRSMAEWLSKEELLAIDWEAFSAAA